MDDYAPSMGCGAFVLHRLLARTPAVLVIAVAGLVFDADVARSQVIEQIGGLIGTEGSAAIEGRRSRVRPSRPTTTPNQTSRLRR